MDELVSIIMPVYNASAYVAEAIDSVLAQDHKNWELLIINDGSQDHSGEIIQSYDDPRIKYFEQKNAGVSAARNVGLDAMTGDYFCFLDGDDQFTINSLSSRLQVFNAQPELSFVDGVVSSRNQNMSQEVSKWTPRFEGEPLEDLIALTGRSFFGITWMIKRGRNKTYQFDTTLTHSEDLWFFIQLASNAYYSFTEQTTYLRRIVSTSAMSNLDGLGKGYRSLEDKIATLDIAPELLHTYRKKRKRIMFKSFLRAGRVWAALKYLMD